MSRAVGLAARLLLTASLAVGMVACAGGGGSSDDSDAAQASEVPVDLAAFIDRIAEPGKVPFTARYAVLQKFGDQTTSTDVVSTPPAWQVRVGDVEMTGGSSPKTCSGSPPTCVDQLVETHLTPFGLTSNFFSTGAARSLTDAGMRSQSEPTFSSRTEAGIELDCATVELGTFDRTVCITAEGVVGLIDDSARRIVITSYAPS